MCIIAYYMKNLALNKHELETCFEHNHDGAGIMYQEKGRVHIQKGFMDFKSFWEVAKNLPTDVDRVFHFRIATSGKVSPGICHPFPICDDYKKMKFIDSTCSMALAHNGVLSKYTPADGMKDNKSDTMVFTKEVINNLDDGMLIQNTAVRELIENYTTSRFAIMDGHEVYLIGDFEQSEDSKAIYSNDSYKERKTTYWNYGYDGLYGGCYDYYGTTKYKKPEEKEEEEIKEEDETYLNDAWDCDGFLRFKDRKFTDDELEEIMLSIEDDFNVTCRESERDRENDEIYIYYDGNLPTGTGTLSVWDIEYKAESLKFPDEIKTKMTVVKPTKKKGSEDEEDDEEKSILDF